MLPIMTTPFAICKPPSIRQTVTNDVTRGISNVLVNVS